MIDTTIGPYRIVEKLGEGGMGVVYRAEDSRLGRSVAIKVLSAAGVDQPEARRRFLQEAQAAALLDHRNICSVHAVEEAENGDLFMVMSFYPGATLRERIGRGPLPLDEAVDIAGQIAAGLGAAHEKGIVHRDIKPANVLMTDDGVAKLLDFGVAKLVGQTRMTRTGTLLGTVIYMSPEQLIGGDVDLRSDIWALGVVFFEMLTGRPPFIGDNEQAYMYSLLNRPPMLARLGGAPAWVRTIIRRCLNKDRSRRYASCADLLLELNQPLTEQGWIAPQTPDSAPFASELETLVEPSDRRADIPTEDLGFLTGDLSVDLLEVETSRFVGRETDLAWLGERLAAVVAGSGRVAFVCGDAGAGKTTLVEEFCRRAVADDETVVVVGGRCNAQAGAGDPYHPFREALALLACDNLEARWQSGAVSYHRAQRLWKRFPETLRAILDAGSDLISAFVPGQALLSRAQGREDLDRSDISRLERIASKTESDGPFRLEQADLFEQYRRVLEQIGRDAPVIVVIDDLHWADSGTANLLFHLGRRLTESRILLLGTYRPELSLSGDGESRHPMTQVINELTREMGAIELDLGQRDGRAFVDALLDSEPSHFSAAFREALFQQTGGHPLFTVEVLRSLEQRGVIARDEEGYWYEAGSPQWDELPARVEAVIAERIDRLPRNLVDILTDASVEGEEFTVEVLAAASGERPRKLIRLLSGELDRRHRLVRAMGVEQVGQQQLSKYRFAHALYQRYLYERLDVIERGVLHDDVGQALEALYGDESRIVAADLAHHFVQANRVEKALEYLLLAAARAARVSAHQEALSHLRRGLELVARLPQGEVAQRQELALRSAMAPVLIALGGYCAPEIASTYARARELSEELDDLRHQFWVHWGIGATRLVCGKLARAPESAARMIELAEQVGDPVLLLGGHYGMGIDRFFLGELAAARSSLAKGVAHDAAGRERAQPAITGEDVGVTARCFLALAETLAGDLEGAAKWATEALELAERIEHPFSSAFALTHVTYAHLLSGDATTAREILARAAPLAVDKGLLPFVLMNEFATGALEALAGSPAEGRARMQGCLDHWRGSGAQIWQTLFLAHLAEAALAGGDPASARELVDEALATAESTSERFWLAELERLDGEVLSAMNEPVEQVEERFRGALERARRQGAALLALRAAVSLARLLAAGDRRAEATELLGRALADVSGRDEWSALEPARRLAAELV